MHIVCSAIRWFIVDLYKNHLRIFFGIALNFDALLEEGETPATRIRE